MWACCHALLCVWLAYVTMPHHRHAGKHYSVPPRVAILQPTNGSQLLNSNVTLTVHVFGGVVERTVTVISAWMRNSTASEFVVSEFLEEDLCVLPFPVDYFRPGSYVITASVYGDEDPVADRSSTSNTRLRPDRWLQRQKLASSSVEFDVVSSLEVLAKVVEGADVSLSVEGPAPSWLAVPLPDLQRSKTELAGSPAIKLHLIDPVDGQQMCAFLRSPVASLRALITAMHGM